MTNEPPGQTLLTSSIAAIVALNRVQNPQVMVLASLRPAVHKEEAEPMLAQTLDDRIGQGQGQRIVNRFDECDGVVFVDYVLLPLASVESRY